MVRCSRASPLRCSREPGGLVGRCSGDLGCGERVGRRPVDGGRRVGPCRASASRGASAIGSLPACPRSVNRSDRRADRDIVARRARAGAARPPAMAGRSSRAGGGNGGTPPGRGVASVVHGAPRVDGRRGIALTQGADAPGSIVATVHVLMASAIDHPADGLREGGGQAFPERLRSGRCARWRDSGADGEVPCAGYRHHRSELHCFTGGGVWGDELCPEAGMRTAWGWHQVLLVGEGESSGEAQATGGRYDTDSIVR